MMDSEFKSIDHYIQHRPPMVFVDRVVEFGDDYVVTEFIVKSDTLFMTEWGLPTWTAIEMMAQTVGVYSGIKMNLMDRELRLGFLLGTRNMKLDKAYFSLAEKLTIRADKILLGENNLGQFSCCLSSADIKIEAKLNVYEP